MTKQDKILEAIQRQHELMVEQFGIVNKKLESHDGKFEKIVERFDQIDGKLEKHDDQFEKIDGRFDRVEAAVLDTRKIVEENTRDIKELKKTVDVAVTNHESRLRRLEEKVSL